MIIIPSVAPDPKTRFVDSVLATIARHGLLPRADDAGGARETILVGTSGGPDSVALLRVLALLAEKRLAIFLVAAHLNHGLRGKAADEDQAFVENLARELKLPCEAARADIRAEAEAAGIGIEEAGRMARRRFFAQAARKHGVRKVALAHHADDRAETVLFNILRGTGIEGLASLGPRAMLSCEVGAPNLPRGTAGLSSRGGPPVTFPTAGQASRAKPLDPKPEETNLADYHTRNRVRNQLLPLLAQEFNPKVDEALVRLSEQASAAGDVLADALDEVWRKIVRETPAVGAALRGCPGTADKGGHAGPPLRATIVIDADDFVGLRPWMQGAVIRRAVERLGGGLKHMSAERTREIVDALLSKTVVGPIDLPGDLVAERNRRAIRIGRRT